MLTENQRKSINRLSLRLMAKRCGLMNCNYEEIPIVNKLDNTSDMDDAWYVVCEYDEEPMEIVYKSIEREKAIDYARDLKRRNVSENVKIYHDFDR